MKIACVGYRPWALTIYKKLEEKTNHKIIVQDSQKAFDCQIIKNFCPDLVLFYGWSWKVPDELINNFKCLMLHPSPLPKYRGGSPIQNQIINNDLDSKITIFIMDQNFDSGPIVGQAPLNLKNSMKTIFKNISEKGFQLTKDILDNGLKPIQQDEKLATYYKRRKPEDSEITLKELQFKSGIYLINKIRMLASPYPNAYIKTADGHKIIIEKAKLIKDVYSKTNKST